MSTNVTLTDALPRDAGGQKFAALVNDQTSQLDFAMWKSIAASTIGSKILGYGAIGTHSQGSKVESLHPFVSVGGVYIDPTTTQASPVSSGRGKIAQMSGWGELYATPAPRTVATLTSGSKNTVKVGSAVVHSFCVSYSAVSLGETFTLSDNVDFRAAIVATSAAGNGFVTIPAGGWLFSASVTLQRTLGGAASLTVSYT